MESNQAIITSAINFTQKWCNLFVGEEPEIARAIKYFALGASILIPSSPYRLDRGQDEEEVTHSHLVDGRGLVHYGQVLEPRVAVAGDVAVVSYYARHCIARTGESVIKFAKETLVLAPEGDEWRIVHMHNSAA